LRAIGVSNFGVGHLKKLAATAEIVPAVNQIELTPFLQRRKLVDYCTSHNILLEVSFVRLRRACGQPLVVDFFLSSSRVSAHHWIIRSWWKPRGTWKLLTIS
jgi:diketogulonate reductase-like aldo/keto reductase